MDADLQEIIRGYERSEPRQRELVRKAAADRKATAWARRDYVMHRHNFYPLNIQLSLGRQAVSLWYRRRWLVELCIARMRDTMDRQLLERRNLKHFGDVVMPSIGFLMTEAAEQGGNEQSQYEHVIRWIVRPDLYSYRDLDSGSIAMKDLRGIKKENPIYSDKKVVFAYVDDPDFPLQAVVGPDNWTIRIGDFPELPLYTLLIQGSRIMDFDNWPKMWTRPTTVSNGSAIYPE